MLLTEVFLKLWVIRWGAGEDYQFEITSCADVVPGCTDVNALNQNLDATHDDGSCEYAVPSLLTPESGSVFDVSTTDSIVFMGTTISS